MTISDEINEVLSSLNLPANTLIRGKIAAFLLKNKEVPVKIAAELVIRECKEEYKIYKQLFKE